MTSGVPPTNDKIEKLGHADSQELNSRIWEIATVLLHGEQRAKEGCVASESVLVFKSALDSLKRLQDAIDR